VSQREEWSFASGWITTKPDGLTTFVNSSRPVDDWPDQAQCTNTKWGSGVAMASSANTLPLSRGNRTRKSSKLATLAVRLTSAAAAELDVRSAADEADTKHEKAQREKDDRQQKSVTSTVEQLEKPILAGLSPCPQKHCSPVREEEASERGLRIAGRNWPPLFHKTQTPA
jgi:hypothetical protein